MRMRSKRAVTLGAIAQPWHRGHKSARTAEG